METRTAVAGLVVSFGLLATALTGCSTTVTSGTAVASNGVSETHIDQEAMPHAPTTKTTDEPKSIAPANQADVEPAVPAPNADVILGSTSQRSGLHIALTFDDGPDPAWTPQVLGLLAQYHAKATFCLIGTNAKAYPALVRKIAADGHALCDHTMHHDEHLPDRPSAVRHAEIEDGRQAILAAVPDVHVPFYRAPGGAFSRPGDPDSVQKIAASLGMRPLAWSIDTVDWTRPGTTAIVTAVERAGSHDVVLLHDGGGNRDQTIAALRIVLPWLVAHGYQFDFPG